MSEQLTCPSGHPARRIVTKKKGQGRVVCTVCNWNDAQTVIGSTPAEAQSPAQGISSPQDRRDTGVRVLGGTGEGVRILRGS